MNAATGTSPLTSVSQPLLAMAAAAALMLALNACQPADRAAVEKRVEAKWEDRQLLFVGDAGRGQVKVFHLRAAPQYVGELRAPGRMAVQDIRVDPTGGRIWVLGDAAVYVHDARSFSLIRRIPLPSSEVARLELDEAGSPLLISSAGSIVGRVEPLTLSAQPRRLAGG